jgi:hypothetical protein
MVRLIAPHLRTPFSPTQPGFETVFKQSDELPVSMSLTKKEDEQALRGKPLTAFPTEATHAGEG